MSGEPQSLIVHSSQPTAHSSLSNSSLLISNSMIRVITIDFWNTLFDSSNDRAREQQRESAIMEQIRLLGQDVPREKVNASLKSAWKFFDKEWLEKQRTPTTKELVHHFWEFLEMIHDEKISLLLETAFSEMILSYPPALMSGVTDALRDLSADHSLALISDTAYSPGSILQRLMDSHDVLRYFSAFSFSDETGVSKPHEKAYMHVLDALGAAPGEAVHIGDIERTDVLGAKRLGMKAILYKGDKNSPMRVHEEEGTIADYTASNWEDIVSWIRRQH
jgi:putative hydrolase of the HAD superfamily